MSKKIFGGILHDGKVLNVVGTKGDTGQTGAVGPQGEQGEQGAPFTYDDFTAEQLEALRGPQGIQGNQGAQGPKGDPFTYSDFTPEQIESLKVKGDKGDKGDQGDSAVYDPSSPDVPDFVMANTTGQSTTKAMTQKAVTDAIQDNSNLIYTDIDFSSAPHTHYINGSKRWATANNNDYGYIVPVLGGETLYIVPNTGAYNIEFLPSNLITGPFFIYEYRGWSGDAGFITVPEMATHMYVRASATSGGTACMPLKISHVRNITSAISKIKDNQKVILNVKSYKDFPYKMRHNTGGRGYNAEGVRFTIGIDVEPGMFLTYQSNYSTGCLGALYDTFDNGCVAAAGGTGRIAVYSNYTHNTVSVNIEQQGVLVLKWVVDAAATDVDIQDLLDDLTVSITYKDGVVFGVGSLKTQVEHLEDYINTISASEAKVTTNRKDLYVGKLVQKSISANTFSNSNYCVTQLCAVVVPEYNTKVSIKAPAGYSVGFKYGYSTAQMDTSWAGDSGRLYNGNSYVFNDHQAQLYRTYFEKNDGAATLTVEEVNNLLQSGSIAITYYSDDDSVVVRNSESEKYIKNVMRKFVGTLAQQDSLTKMPTFTHMSDNHGDALRFQNFIEYSDMLGVDAALISGDMVPMCGAYDYTDYIDDIGDKFNVPVLPCIGNHDARRRTTEQAQNEILAHSIDKYALTVPDMDYPTYYYKDFESKKIRLIALNNYCAGQNGTNEWRITQSQLTWFVGVLMSTPQDYGVIVMMHSPETTTVKDSSYDKFYQSGEDGLVWHTNPFFPFRKIIDAFIGKTTINTTFTETITGNVEQTLTIDADFSNVATGVEFICYVTGHRHKDCIGVVDGAEHRQLMCNIALGFALYGDSNYHYYAELCDVPRGGKGVTQDLFNVYVIDRTAGTIRIARVGSSMTASFEMRDYMIIPYK